MPAASTGGSSRCATRLWETTARARPPPMPPFTTCQRGHVLPGQRRCRTSGQDDSSASKSEESMPLRRAQAAAAPVAAIRTPWAHRLPAAVSGGAAQNDSCPRCQLPQLSLSRPHFVMTDVPSPCSMEARNGPCSGLNGRRERGCLPCSWTPRCTGSGGSQHRTVCSAGHSCCADVSSRIDILSVIFLAS